MSNIACNLDNVNFFNSLTSLLYVFAPSEKYFDVVETENNFNATIKAHNESFNQDKCALHISASFANVPKLKNNIDRDYSKTYRKLKDFRAAMRSGIISDEVIKKSLSVISSLIGTQTYLDANGNYRCFTSNTRGTERYGKKQANFIQDWIKTQCDLGKETFFLTLTCDKKKYAHAEEAWREYNAKEVKPVLEYWRKKKGCEYIGVMESTNKGYPHIHLVLCFPKGTIKGYDKMHNKQKIFYGELVKHLGRKGNSEIKYLECAKGDNLKYYLTKYVTKSTEKNVLDLQNKKDSLTKTERKDALTLLCPKSVNKRSLLACKIKRVNEKPCESSEHEAGVLSETSFIKKIVTARKSGELTDRELARLRAYLTRLCTNSPLKCNAPMYYMSYNRFYSMFHAKCKDVDPNNPENLLKLLKNSKCTSCQGCFFMSLIALLRSDCKYSRTDSHFMRDFTNDFEKNNEPLTIKDNRDWFNYLSDIINFYLENIVEKHITYESIKNGKWQTILEKRAEKEKKDRILYRDDGLCIHARCFSVTPIVKKYRRYLRFYFMRENQKHGMPFIWDVPYAWGYGKSMRYAETDKALDYVLSRFGVYMADFENNFNIVVNKKVDLFILKYNTSYRFIRKIFKYSPELF